MSVMELRVIVMTIDFPYSVGCFRGKVTSSQVSPGGQQRNGTNGPSSSSMGGQSGQSGGMTPPQEAIMACNSRTQQSTCSFVTPRGSVNGTCKTPPNQSQLACVPNNR
jgi:hypothetical protein